MLSGFAEGIWNDVGYVCLVQLSDPSLSEMRRTNESAAQAISSDKIGVHSLHRKAFSMESDGSRRYSTQPKASDSI